MAVVAGVVGCRGASFLQACCEEINSWLGDYSTGPADFVAFDDIAVAFSPDGAVLNQCQPLVEADRWLMTADVRLDNRDELIARLGTEARGYRSDAELLFRCWRRWEERLAEFAVGDYAFAAFDRQTRKLTLARDPTGQRPLCYVVRNGTIAWASMPAALAALMGKARPDFSTLLRDLAQAAADDDRTPFQEVKRVLPAEIVSFQGGALRKSSWEPRLDDQLRRSDTDFINEFRFLLDQAVSSRMSGDPVATHLSAGWDSNAITATASRLTINPRRLIAYTSAPRAGLLGDLPRGRYADESELAAQAAAHYGVRHVIVRETERDIDVMRRLAPLAQMPIFSPTNVAWWSRIRHLAREAGATTVLTGELGNLTLNNGGLAVLGDLIRTGKWKGWWHEARCASRRSDLRWRGILFNSFGFHLPDWLRDQLTRKFQHVDRAGATDFLRRHWQAKLSQSPSAPLRASGHSYADRWKKMRTDDIGPWRLAALADSGIFERDPTADKRLIEFSLRLPPEKLFHDGQHRPLARAALADRVPATILDASGRGMQSADWHLHLDQRDAYEALEEMRDNSAAADLFNLKAIERTIAAWPSNSWNSGRTRLTYAMDLPAVLATGLFLTQFSRWQPRDNSPRI